MNTSKIFKVTYTSGDTSFIAAGSLVEAKMIANDQTGEEFSLYGLPEIVEPASDSEVAGTIWHQEYRIQRELEAEEEIFGC